MFAVERKNLILQRLSDFGRVRVVTLAADLGLSDETIRRDLASLEAEGRLRRVHGGAVDLAHLTGPEPTMTERHPMRVLEKTLIARAAIAMIPPKGTLFLESASTSLYVAELLPQMPGLTVFTNGVHVAHALGEREDLTVVMVGGRIRRMSLTTIDDWALSALEGLHVDLAFVGALAFARGAGLTTPDLADAAVKRRCLAVADRTVLLAESAKFGMVAACRYGDLTDIDVLVTDRMMCSEAVDGLRQDGISTVLAGDEPSGLAEVAA